MKRILSVFIFIVSLIGCQALPVAFHGKRGRHLRDAVAATCRVRTPVRDMYEWETRCMADARGMVYMPFDGMEECVIPVWPDNMLLAEVVPSEWWRFDNRFKSAACDTLSLDLVNILPVSAEVVSYKSVYPPAELGRMKWTNGVWSCGFLAVDGVETNGWMPPLDFRGDVARTVFYMLTVYPSVSLDPWAFLLVDGSSWPGLTPYAIELLLRWSQEDPVDDYEIRRNAQISDSQGGCGNPFVRWAGLEEYIWGAKAGDVWVDPDADDDERMPLRSVYHLSDARIDLWSPLVSDGAQWSVDGSRAVGHVVPAQIGVGCHEFSYVDPQGDRGRVIITVLQ